MVRRSLESKINKVYLRCSKNYHGLRISSQRLKGETKQGTGSASCLGVKKDLELDLWVTPPAWYLPIFSVHKITSSCYSTSLKHKMLRQHVPQVQELSIRRLSPDHSVALQSHTTFFERLQSIFLKQIRVAVKLPVKRHTRAFESTKLSGRFFGEHKSFHGQPDS